MLPDSKVEENLKIKYIIINIFLNYLSSHSRKFHVERIIQQYWQQMGIFTQWDQINMGN